MKVPHPIPYQGSKRNLASKIMRFLPDDFDSFIEPFAGSAALSLAVAAQNRVNHIVLNDINAPLIALWRYIIHHPHRLSDYYEYLWNAQNGRERHFYDMVRDRFNRTHKPYYFLYLLARCVKASVRYNAVGEFNQSPDNRRKGRRPKAMRRDIEQASFLLNNRTTLMSGSYQSALEKATPDDVIYMDPPYQGVTGKRDSRYISGLDHNLFVESLTLLNDKGISYILSYDGRTEDKNFGVKLPESLNLYHIELDAGRSTQATLLGKSSTTYESLYLSSALVDRIRCSSHKTNHPRQLSLFGEMA